MQSKLTLLIIAFLFFVVRNINACDDFGNFYLANSNTDIVKQDSILNKPQKLTINDSCNSIFWSWQNVIGADGYKINFVNEYESSFDVGNQTTYMQKNPGYEKFCSFYVWAYNDSSKSEPLVMEWKTAPWTIGCEYIDERDSQKYTAIVIGNQCWMAQNLNYKTISGSSCYENKESNCKNFGRFYSFDTALTVCPKGWKLPSEKDIDELINHFNTNSVELGQKLTANQKVGFNLKFGGYCDYTDKSHYRYVGEQVGIWTSTTINSTSAYFLFVCTSFGAVKMKSPFGLGEYVRCIKE